MKPLFRLLLAWTALLLPGCEADPDAERATECPAIASLSLDEHPQAVVRIDREQLLIRITLPAQAVPGPATLRFSLEGAASADPESGSTIDLSQPQTITLTTASGATRTYILAVDVAPSQACELRALVCPEPYAVGQLADELVSLSFPYGTDLTALHLQATLSPGASIDPDLRTPVDLSRPLPLTVTAADGTTRRTYTVRAETQEPEYAVRGVYVPAPSHTNSFATYANIRASIELLDELRFNTIFLCAWAQSKTAWNSDVLLANSTYLTAQAGNLYGNYSSGSGDAVQDIIALAHEKGIRVILWFEYGFMHRIGGVSTSDPVLARHPEWIGRNSSGGYSNYNGTDYYLNAYDPEVQEFMLALMEEAVERYPSLDGIQGDDRLPAMPRDSGYDETTRALYRADKGTLPPGDPNDATWVRWRLDRLNAFARTMYARLKAKKESLLVCFAPNKYPWCESALMQEWPKWIADGAVDLLTVQFYVTYSYETDVRQALEYVRQNTSKNLLNPAMILKNGSSILPEQVLASQLTFNRSAGTCGESQFWFDGLKEPYVQEVFKKFYPGKAIFPFQE